MRRFVLVAVISACGGSGGTSHPDAHPAIDSSSAVDSPPAIDGPVPTTADVTAYDDGTPVAGADVVFSDPSGAVASHVVTDATGVASATVAPGSMITVIVKQGTSHTLYTFFAVQPGDHLVAGSPIATSNVVGSAHVILPGAVTGATDYWADLGCDFGSGSVPFTADIDVYSSCGSTFGVLATARDSQGTILAWSSLTGLPITPSTNALLPAWRTDVTPFSVAITHGTPLAGLAGSLLMNHGAMGFLGPPMDGTLDASGARTISPGVPNDGSLDSLTVDMREVLPSMGGATILRSRFQRLASVGAGVAEDLSNLPPALTGRTIDVAPAKTTPEAAWTSAGDLAAATDGLWIEMNWSDGMGGGWEWIGIAPSTAASPLQFPDLPDSLAEDRVTPGQTFGSLHEVELVKSDLFAGAAAWRQDYWKIMFVTPAMPFTFDSTSAN
jgi:hypothetical protein